MEEQIKKEIKDGLINENLEPIKCNCGSINFYDKIVDRLDYLVVEKERYCTKCDKLVGYWSYGYWMI